MEHLKSPYSGQHHGSSAHFDSFWLSGDSVRGNIGMNGQDAARFLPSEALK